MRDRFPAQVVIFAAEYGSEDEQCCFGKRVEAENFC